MVMLPDTATDYRMGRFNRATAQAPSKAEYREGNQQPLAIVKIPVIPLTKLRDFML